MAVIEAQPCREARGAAAHRGIYLRSLPIVERFVADRQRESGAELIRCICGVVVVTEAIDHFWGVGNGLVV